MPVDGLVEIDQAVFLGGGAYEPGLDRVAHQGRALAPVMRIVVQVVDAFVEQAAIFKVAHDRFVGVLEP